ncbi:hypothetical protein OIU77_007806 [Salix suchowensis]|uniref:Uncharacterized protein n=1 Tax=Salix suchowensis TaxID=1278906 RepID=A0ABQ9AIR9_9ROSI|nr:hypothetical protein OIU77_007806 [Salix suchowensis]
MMISVMWEVWEHREQLTPITQKKEVCFRRRESGRYVWIVFSEGEVVTESEEGDVKRSADGFSSVNGRSVRQWRRRRRSEI